MIDFATSIQKTRNYPERHDEAETYVGGAVVDEKGAGASSYSDTARRIIASRPAMYFTIALAVGGILGWLTSKR